jgi:tol-pal system protein YbgF
MTKAVGRKTGAFTSLSSASSFRGGIPRLAAAAACAAVAAVAGCATRADLLEVQHDQRAVRALLADQQVAIEGLRRRMEILRSDQSEPGKRHGGPATADTSRQLNDLEGRVAALELARPSVPPSAATASVEVERPPVEIRPAPAVPPTPPAPKVQSPQEVALAKEETAAQSARVDGDYREALGLVKRGQCTQAVPRLRDFVRKNPKSDFADNALYWVGACYYGQRDYSRAIVEFNDLVLKYPKGDKVPAALMMMADAFADSGDKIDARLVLQKLISQYPQAEEAGQARQKLPSLGE